MTRIALRIEHKHLPAAVDFNVEPTSSEEINGAVASFEHVLSTLAGDDTLIVTKTGFVVDQETIYFISSSLDKAALILAIERTLTALKLGGYILELTDEIKVGSIEEV